MNWQTDGARLWKNVQLPFTTSSSTAQRIAKIEMLRGPQQGRETLQGRMSMYQSVPLDNIYMSMPVLGWSNKILEAQAVRFKLDTQSGAPKLGVEMDLQENDPSVFDSSVTEELSIQGYPQTASAVVAAPPATNTETLSVGGLALASATTGYTVSVNGTTLSSSNPNIGVAD